MRVALIDSGGIASGGSGAAGAFVSPKFVKSGPVKEVSETAFAFSLPFYAEHFKEWTSVSPLLHIANNALSNERVRYFKAHTSLQLITPEPTSLKQIRPEARTFESLMLASSAVVNARGVCEAMAEHAEFFDIHVRALEHDGHVWHLDNNIRAKRVLLATGAHQHLLNIPYVTPRPIFGHRINIKSSTYNPVNIHQHVSISQSNTAGIIAIGATHDVHHHRRHTQEQYDYIQGRSELLEKAMRTVALHDVEIIEDFIGVRAASIDHLPMLGPVVDSCKTLEKLPKIEQGKRYNINQYEYYPNLYMMNGVGGYGFVLAPYLAAMLRDAIVKNGTIHPLVLPSRFLRRWCIQKCR